MAHPKIVTDPHYHLWTDALHARSLALQAKNRWDRGTYVRWTVTTAWTVLEIACQSAVEAPEVSYRFRENLDLALSKGGHASLDWGTGIWQCVRDLQGTRKGYVHRFPSEEDLFPAASEADRAIEIVRAAVTVIYQHVGRPAPPWITDDQDRGWDSGTFGGANLTLVHPGTSLDDESALKVCFVYAGEEKVSEVVRAGTDYLPFVEDLIRNVRVPISAVRVYQGSKLVHERLTPMRGT